MELTIKVAIQKELMTRQAADIAHRMSEFESRVLLKRQNLTVNAKSLMGVLSADLRDGHRRCVRSANCWGRKQGGRIFKLQTAQGEKLSRETVDIPPIFAYNECDIRR